MTVRQQKAYNLIGIAKKAGKIIAGTEMVVESIRAKKKNVKAVFISCDASQNTLKRITNTSDHYKIPAFKTEIDKASLGRITGASGERSVIGITDEGLAKAIISNISDET